MKWRGFQGPKGAAPVDKSAGFGGIVKRNFSSAATIYQSRGGNRHARGFLKKKYGEMALFARLRGRPASTAAAASAVEPKTNEAIQKYLVTAAESADDIERGENINVGGTALLSGEMRPAFFGVAPNEHQHSI